MFVYFLHRRSVISPALSVAFDCSATYNDVARPLLQLLADRGHTTMSSLPRSGACGRAGFSRIWDRKQSLYA